MRYYVNQGGKETFEIRLYRFLVLICWIDIFVSSHIIMLTDLVLRTTVTPYDMVLGLCAVRILCDLDDYFTGSYINLIVEWSEDGVKLN
jgi:hypothetical protein